MLKKRTNSSLRRTGSWVGRFVALGWVGLSAACGNPEPTGEAVSLVVPEGAYFRQVVDTLVARDIIERPTVFRIYARLKGLDDQVRAGQYRIIPGQDFATILEDLTTGRVVTVPVTLPEGLTLKAIAGRLASVVEEDSVGVYQVLSDSTMVEALQVPGPTLEGYLFPDTYRFAQGVPLSTVLETMAAQYRSFWTPDRRARLAEMERTEREIVTLASIIQAEARRVHEMPTISSVYHNRLRIGMLLQADPTVLYALGGYRARLLYAAIDSVQDHPYNTYTQGGLPPGPIGAPGDLALEAALYPADEDYLYFVARSDGTHVFTRTLREHNNARIMVRRERTEN